MNCIVIIVNFLWLPFISKKIIHFLKGLTILLNENGIMSKIAVILNDLPDCPFEDIDIIIVGMLGETGSYPESVFNEFFDFNYEHHTKDRAV